MKTRDVIVALFAILLCGFSCQTQRAKQPVMKVGEKTFLGIGAVGGSDTNAHARVKIILKENEIENIIEGSAVYGIWVPEDHADYAETILRKDSRENNYWIYFEDN